MSLDVRVAQKLQVSSTALLGFKTYYTRENGEHMSDAINLAKS